MLKWLKGIGIWLKRLWAFLFENREALFTYFGNLTPIGLLIGLSLLFMSQFRFEFDCKGLWFEPILTVLMLVVAFVLFLLNAVDLKRKLIRSFPELKQYEEKRRLRGEKVNLCEALSYLKKRNGGKQFLTFLIVYLISVCVVLLAGIITAVGYMRILPDWGRLF